MGISFSIFNKKKDVDILNNEKFKKYLSTLKNLEFYSNKKINTDVEGNYIFPILPDSEIYNDRSLVKYYSSFTNNNEIKVFNYLDLDLHSISPDKYEQRMLGIYCLVIGAHQKDFVLSIIEREFPGSYGNELFFETDLYNGFIPLDDCKYIKIFIDNNLFEEFNNCKKDCYYQFKIPIIVYLMKDKITVQTDKEYIKINFVVTFLNCNNKSKLDKKIELRNLFAEFILDKPYSNKILGTYLGFNENYRILKYSDEKITTKQLLYEIKDLVINFYSQQYLNNLKTKYIQNELIEKSWHPNRVINWCLDIEEQKELCY